MKKALLVLLFSLVPLFVFADPAGICSWESDGCERFVVFFEDGTGDSYINCGDGAMYVGSGQYGGCPADGIVEHW